MLVGVTLGFMEGENVGVSLLGLTEGFLVDGFGVCALVVGFVGFEVG